MDSTEFGVLQYYRFFIKYIRDSFNNLQISISWADGLCEAHKLASVLYFFILGLPWTGEKIRAQWEEDCTKRVTHFSKCMPNSSTGMTSEYNMPQHTCQQTIFVVLILYVRLREVLKWATLLG